MTQPAPTPTAPPRTREPPPLRRRPDPLIDCAIVGGGPAGLAAALTLARARRTVTIIDAGHPRNAVARSLHGYLTRDGIRPGNMLKLGWAEVLGYPTAKRIDARVVEAKAVGTGFALKLENAPPVLARKLVLATGVADELPPVPGAREVYGTALVHCPYCDGWEHRDQVIGVYGRGERGYKLARFLLNWTSTVAALWTDGPHEMTRRQIADLARLGIPVREMPILRLAPREGGGLFVCEDENYSVWLEVMFFNLPSFGRSALAEMLGAKVDEEGAIATSDRGLTSVPGLYAAGNVQRDVMLTQVAAAQGVEAAFEIVSELVQEDLGE